jgi:hypothetical protein
MDLKFWANAVLGVGLIYATTQNTRVIEESNRAAAAANKQVDGTAPEHAMPRDWYRY